MFYCHSSPPVDVWVIDGIVEAVNLDDYFPKNTLTEYTTVPKDGYGEDCNYNFNYISITCMILNLLVHSRPEISCSMSQCARFFYLKMIHEMVLKRIGRYLKGTQTKGMIRWPHQRLKFRLTFWFWFRWSLVF